MSARGVFVTIDGPSGVGKSTTVAEVHRLLGAQGVDASQTVEPSTSGLGEFIRKYANHFTGRALACLVAANRYEHVEFEIEPALADGRTVVCDRYLASTLVLQRLDGVPEQYLLDISRDVLLPDLAVILTASPGLIAERIATRGVRHRFHLDPTAPGREVDLYAEAAQSLMSMGVRVLVLDTSDATPTEVASRIADAVPPPSVASDATTTPTTNR
ncbi:dTMP kinase [Streptomyces griseus]|uniref:dTMP kinase n=1 Tax=Streptomyces griseus TaxID=1911 RepID=UPI00381AA8AC